MFFHSRYDESDESSDEEQDDDDENEDEEDFDGTSLGHATKKAGQVLCNLCAIRT